MEFQVWNVVFVSISYILTGLFFVLLYHQFGTEKMKERVSTKIFNTVVGLIVGVFVFFNATSYGFKVNTLSVPNQVYVPQVQEIDSGKPFVDSGPSRIGQFDEALQKFPIKANPDNE